MKSVRIYKDDIRVHILRSLFFTDSAIAAAGALIIALVAYLFFQNVLHSFNFGYFISSVILLEIFFVGLITQKVDNQPIYKIIPRGVTFKSTKKELRQSELEPYFVDFSIQDNLIFRKQSIVGIYEVEPFDIALLNNEDREHFFIKLKQTIHNLPSQVQFIVKKDRATMKDYSNHIFSLYDNSNNKREGLIGKYSKDLSTLIKTGNFMATRHYAVFSVPANTSKVSSKTTGIKKLHDMSIRFASSLNACRIYVRQLKNEELIEFVKQTLR